MTGPTRSSRAGQAYRDLQNLARRQNRSTQELLELYVLEGFLERLAASQHSSRLVLKGGVLLAAYDTRRPTRDVDLHASDLANETDAVLTMVRDIAAGDTGDGVVYDPASASAETIREGDEYSGVRVSLRAKLASADISFHVDANVGDPVRPPATTIWLPRILGGHIELRGYPLAMVLAEKALTALDGEQPTPAGATLQTSTCSYIATTSTGRLFEKLWRRSAGIGLSRCDPCRWPWRGTPSPHRPGGRPGSASSA